MDDIIKFETVSDYNDFMGVETLHPLISVIDFSKVNPIQSFKHSSGFYAIFLKTTKCGDIRYGRNVYDYREGTMMFVAPGQITEVTSEEEYFQPHGLALLFHPDLLRGTSLGMHIHDYNFFSYEVFEALHLSTQEKQTIEDYYNKINVELSRAIDKHSIMLITANIELLLSYCVRFYDRQFITRSHLNQDVLSRFEKVLNSYFKSELPQTLGLPTVKYCAEQLHLSSNYFGDLIKKETGKSAQEHIQHKLMEIAKERIFDKSKSISEIAYELGFKHPQHFTRVFKSDTGHTPVKYRALLLN